MPTVDEMPAAQDPVHLLLVADSKAGKSTYAAMAAAAGFNVLYIDADNGLSAIRNALKGNLEAMKRIHYFRVRRPRDFVRELLRSHSKKKFRWAVNQSQLWGKLMSGIELHEKVWEFDYSKIPNSWIIVIDSWTAISADALGIGDGDQAAKLLDGVDQSIYGDASGQLNFICNILQKIPQHCIVQAHGTKYEVYDKPLNATGAEMKQAKMILREIIDVPLSSSRPHGLTMGSRFNHIGWLSVNHMGQTEIDFTRKPGRVGGGPPNCKKLADVLNFKELVGGVPPLEDAEEGWFRELTHEEAKAA